MDLKRLRTSPFYRQLLSRTKTALAGTALRLALCLLIFAALMPVFRTPPAQHLPFTAAVVGFMLVASAGKRRRSAALLRPKLPLAHQQQWRAWAAGAAAAVAGFWLLEWQAPAYFTQDDNFAQFAPVMIAAAKGFFSGVFPTWNPYQLLGQPTTVVGTYALTYPPTYLSYLLAKELLGDAALTLEVFAALHMALGYCVSFKLLSRCLRIDPWLAAASSLVYIYSGYTLIAGRSWYYMMPLVLWLPLLTLLQWRLWRRPDKTSAVTAGVALGLFFHAGNAQMWFYTALLLGLWQLLFVVSGQARRRWMAAVLASWLLALLVAAPLLISQVLFMADVTRQVWGNGILPGILALGLPYPIVEAPHPNHWFGGRPAYLMTSLYYCGTLQVAATLGLVWSVLGEALRSKAPWRAFASPVTCLAALLLLVLALAYGPSGYLWNQLASLQIFNRLAHPFKLLGIIAWLVAVLGSLQMQKLLSSLPRRTRAWLLPALVLGAVTGLFWHLHLAQTAFHVYGDRPYPELAPALAQQLASAKRVMSWTPPRSAKPGYYASMPHNLPTYYQLGSLTGYDPIVQQKPESQTPAARWSDYGVDTVLIATEGEQPEQSARLAAKLHLTKVYTSPEVTVYHLPNAAGLVFSQAGQTASLELDAAGLSFSTPDDFPGGEVTINFLWRSGMSVQMDGQGRELGHDQLRRMTLVVAPGHHQIAVRYDQAWQWGYLLITVLSLLLGGLLLVVFRSDRRKP